MVSSIVKPDNLFIKSMLQKQILGIQLNPDVAFFLEFATKQAHQFTTSFRKIKLCL